MVSQLTDAELRMARSVGWIQHAADFLWTRDQVDEPLRPTPFDELVARVRAGISDARLIIPDVDVFIRRTVAATLTGHLVLQGPPGTGKTTFAGILARAFEADLKTTTATAEWSTYDVVGGLRPSPEGGLEPVLGAISSAALDCARLVEDSRTVGSTTSTQAVWLLIDELNRADIDKAIGSLYTVLSSASAEHLRAAPLELWFESTGRQALWFPSRFRIIGTMNDVDTSYVNTISQGLTRRFQFVTLGVSTERSDQEAEVRAALLQASDWALTHRGFPGAPELDIVTAQQNIANALVDLLNFVRSEAGLAWALGTAQMVSVWRTALIGGTSLIDPVSTADLDSAVTDQLIPQAGSLSVDALETFATWLERHSLPASARAVKHLMNTNSPF